MIFLFILTAFVVAMVGLHFNRVTNWQTRIFSLLFDTIYTLIGSLAVARFIFQQHQLFSTPFAFSLYGGKVVLLTLVVGSLLLWTKKIVMQRFPQNKSKNKRGLRSLLTIFFILGSILSIGSFWFIHFFGKLTPEQFIFNFNSPVTGTADGVTQAIIDTPVLGVLTLILIFLVILWYPTYSRVSWRVISAIILGIFLGGTAYSVHELQLIQVYHAYFDNSTYVETNYVDPKKTKLAFPEKKRNFIHLYLESYENSYFDKASGGFMTDDLMPDLKKLSAEGIHFSHNEAFGGPYQTYGSSWSVASMINMNAGLPLKIPMNGNSYGKSGQFLPGATTLGDILHDEGYEQTVMFGADADFGGLTSFFSTHGDFKIFDLKYARKTGLIPKDYKVWWGYEDKKLYEYAKSELTRLAATNKPFHFAMENADTHFPDGYLEPGAATPYDSQYANVILHSQKEIVQLVRWIQKQPFYENTTILLTGDHLSMDKKFFKDFDKNYHRTTFNLVLNPDFKNKHIQATNRMYAPFDYFPTILSSLGVTIPKHRLGLGTDLSSNVPTLLERDGVEHFDEQLSQNSQFYNQAFVSEKNAK